MTKKPDPKKILTLSGHLGGDPESRSLPAKVETGPVYDPITDQVVERTVRTPELNFLAYSLATGGYDDHPLCWHSCIDQEGVGFRLRKGDRVRLTGYFHVRAYASRGQTRTSRRFIVLGVEILRAKSRESAAP